MSEGPINMHKRIAMGQPGAETHLKKGGKVKKYAKAGGDMTKAYGGKVSTMKSGGMTRRSARGC
jgi:hypothetical protein